MRVRYPPRCDPYPSAGRRTNHWIEINNQAVPTGERGGPAALLKWSCRSWCVRCHSAITHGSVKRHQRPSRAASAAERYHRGAGEFGDARRATAPRTAAVGQEEHGTGGAPASLGADKALLGIEARHATGQSMSAMQPAEPVETPRKIPTTAKPV